MIEKIEKTSKMGCEVNTRLLPMKTHYFLASGLGAMLPFLPVYARHLGFSSLIVGFIYLVLPAFGLVSKPLFGAIADRYRQHKTMFIASILFTTFALYSVQFIPSMPKHTRVTLTCENGDIDIKYCPKHLDMCAAKNYIRLPDTTTNHSMRSIEFDLECLITDDWMWDFICKNWKDGKDCARDIENIAHLKFFALNNYENVEKINTCLMFGIQHGVFYDSPLEMFFAHTAFCPNVTAQPFQVRCQGTVNDTKVMEIIGEPGVKDRDVVKYSQFWLFFGALVLAWVGLAIVISVGDTICFSLLGDKPHLFGRQRLWGAAGWGIFSFLAGYLMDRGGKDKKSKNYSVIFQILLCTLLPDTFVASCLQIKPKKASANILRDIGRRLISWRIFVFLIWCIVVGINTAIVWNFLFWHLEDLADNEAGCGHEDSLKTLEGLTIFIQCIGGELPFFLISGWLIKLIGHINSMTLVLFAFSIRLFLYSILTNPWWVLPIELMQGLTFGIFFATMATYANIVAPKGTEATLQGLVGAIFEGIGVSSGSFIGGMLMKRLGGSATFRLFSILSFTCGVLHLIVQLLLDRRTKYQKPNNNLNNKTDTTKQLKNFDKEDKLNTECLLSDANDKVEIIKDQSKESALNKV